MIYGTKATEESEMDNRGIGFGAPSCCWGGSSSNVE